MSFDGHVRFEFHPGWSTEARVIIDGQTIPILIRRPIIAPQTINQPLMSAEWNWTWPDGNRYQLFSPVNGVSAASTASLRRNNETVAVGQFRGARFVIMTRQWFWQMGDMRITTYRRIGCKPRCSLRSDDGRCFAWWTSRSSRVHGVIRGRLDASQTPLLWGMILSTLVSPGYSTWSSIPVKQ